MMKNLSEYFDTLEMYMTTCENIYDMEQKRTWAKEDRALLKSFLELKKNYIEEIKDIDFVLPFIEFEDFADIKDKIKEYMKLEIDDCCIQQKWKNIHQALKYLLLAIEYIQK